MTSRPLLVLLPALVPLILFWIPVTAWASRVVVSSGEAPAPDFAAVFRSVGATAGFAVGGAVVGTTVGIALAGPVARTRGIVRVGIVAVLSAPLFLSPAVLTAVVQTIVSGGESAALVRGEMATVGLLALRVVPVAILLQLVAVGSAESGVARRAGSALVPSRTNDMAIYLARAVVTVPVAVAISALLLVPAMEIPLFTLGDTETIGAHFLRVASEAPPRELDGLALVGSAWVVAGLFLAAATALFARAGAPAFRPAARARTGERSGTGSLFDIVAAAGLALLMVAAFVFLAATAFAGSIDAERGYIGRAVTVDFLRAVVCAAVITLAAWISVPPRSARARLAVALLWILPVASPGSLAAIGWTSGVGPGVPVALFDTVVPMSLAQCARVLAVAYLAAAMGRQLVPRSGASLLPSGVRRWGIDLRAAAPVLAAGALIALAFIGSDVECAQLLVPPGYASPAVELHQYLHSRYDETAALVAVATGLFGIAASVGVAAITFRRGVS